MTEGARFRPRDRAGRGFFQAHDANGTNRGTERAGVGMREASDRLEEIDTTAPQGIDEDGGHARRHGDHRPNRIDQPRRSRRPEAPDEARLVRGQSPGVQRSSSFLTACELRVFTMRASHSENMWYVSAMTARAKNATVG